MRPRAPEVDSEQVVDPALDVSAPAPGSTAVGPVSVGGSPAAVQRRRLGAALRVVRRVHLYSGLFLVPWVLLYGVTAFLFNHPRAFADAPTIAVGDAGLARLPAADVVAASVVEALVEAAPGRTIALAGEPRYGHAVAWRVEADGAEHLVIVDPAGEGALIRSSARRAAPSDPPFEVPHVPAGPEAFAAATATVGSLVTAAGLTGGQVKPRNVPDLLLDVTIDGEHHRAAYDLRTGAVTLRPAAGAGRELSARAFLTRLHLAHGYPPRLEARWLWAVIVDVMAAAMCVWAVTGLVMWAQMRALRRPGALALIAGVASAVALGAAMLVALNR
ncbi:MAG: PepSY domain-containing protein [Planctomycetes bacterium]|nr:PepSY domain-containing protein [Planctomycetota bacterium]